MDEPVATMEWQLLNILNPLSFEDIIGLIVMIVLLGCSALASATEVAFFSLSPKELSELKERNDSKSKLILHLLDQPKKLLATILIANNLVNIGIVIISTFITNHAFDFSFSPLLGFFVQVIVVTFLILLIGEVMPKVFANQHSVFIARLMAYPIRTLSILFRPFSAFLIGFTNIFDRRIKKKNPNISVDELSHALELTKNEITDEDEHKILSGIVRFGNTEVSQIMKPRMDVDALDFDTPFSEVMEKVIQSGYSRIPVYKETFDKVEGILYVKDLLSHINEKADFNWHKLLRPSFFVPENKKIDDLLHDFQQKKIHFAIVVDEYGGTSGIVTLEDVMEEIVGEITDEYDDEDLSYSKLDDNNFVFEAKTSLKDIYKVLDVDGEIFEKAKGESDSLGGFVLEQSGKIPQKNEKVKFENFVFTIESADKRRIKRVKITINETV